MPQSKMRVLNQCALQLLTNVFLEMPSISCCFTNSILFACLKRAHHLINFSFSIPFLKHTSLVSMFKRSLFATYCSKKLTIWQLFFHSFFYSLNFTHPICTMISQNLLLVMLLLQVIDSSIFLCCNFAFR